MEKGGVFSFASKQVSSSAMLKKCFSLDFKNTVISWVDTEYY